MYIYICTYTGGNALRHLSYVIKQLCKTYTKINLVYPNVYFTDQTRVLKHPLNSAYLQRAAMSSGVHLVAATKMDNGSEIADGSD